MQHLALLYDDSYFLKNFPEPSVSYLTKMEHLLEEHVSTEDLKKFETRYQTELNGGQVSTSAQFDYAWCLVRSRYPSDIRKGLLLLEDLYRVSFGLTHQFFKNVFSYTK